MADLGSYIRDVPDFPIEGILFKDMNRCSVSQGFQCDSPEVNGRLF